MKVKIVRTALLCLLAAAAMCLVFGAASCGNKSGNADFTVQSVNGKEVTENAVTLTVQEYETLNQAENVLEMIEYSVSEGASVCAVLRGGTIEFTVTAEDGTEKSYEIEIIVLSNDASLSVSEVCGVQVEEGTVKLTKTQYALLSSTGDKAELCEYVLAAGAVMQTALEENILNFAVRSEDGEHLQTYKIQILLLNDAAELVLLGGKGITMDGEKLRCTAEALGKFEAASDIGALLEYQISEGAKVSFEYDTDTMTLHAETISEDGENVKNSDWKVGRKESFFAQKALAIGSDDAIVWNFEKGCYTEEYSSETVRAAYLPDGGAPLAGLYYSFGVDIKMEEANIDAEFVIENVETAGSRIRYYMRYLGEGDYRVYTDYLSYNTGWKGFRELGRVESGTARMEVIRCGNMFLFLLDGKVVWKQEIAFGATQIVLGGERAVNMLCALEEQTDEAAVRAAFEAVADTFEAPHFGRDVLGKSTSSLANFAEDGGVYSFSPNDNKIYLAFAYDNGTALAGQYLEYKAKFSIGEHNKKINPSAGLHILGSNGGILRVYLRRDTNTSGSYDTDDYQLAIDNGLGKKQVRIRYYGNEVELRVLCNGTYTAVYADGVLVFEGNGTSSRIADDPKGLSYTESTDIVGVTGFRHIGVIVCGAAIRLSELECSGYTRVLSTYENKIQAYLDERTTGATEAGIVFAGSSLIEYWRTQHDFSETMQGVNVGLAGSHSADWLQLIDRLIVPYSPEKVVLYVGGNDASKQGNEMAPFVAQSVIRLLDMIHAALPEAQIYWISLITFPALNENNGKSMNIVNEIVQNYIFEKDYLGYIDIASVICPNGTADTVFFEGGDGTHMNDTGYAVLERIVKEKLAEN